MSVTQFERTPRFAVAANTRGTNAASGGDTQYLSELPPTNTKRWTIRRKAAVVAGVHIGLITMEEACERYRLSMEEFLSWQRLIERHGVNGLRATRIQDYRRDAEQD